MNWTLQRDKIYFCRNRSAKHFPKELRKRFDGFKNVQFVLCVSSRWIYSKLLEILVNIINSAKENHIMKCQWTTSKANKRLQHIRRITRRKWLQLELIIIQQTMNVRGKHRNFESCRVFGACVSHLIYHHYYIRDGVHAVR